MGKGESHNTDAPQPRVYKAGDVHKRRASRKARADGARASQAAGIQADGQSPAPIAEDEQPEASEPAATEAGLQEAVSVDARVAVDETAEAPAEKLASAAAIAETAAAPSSDAEESAPLGETADAEATAADGRHEDPVESPEPPVADGRHEDRAEPAEPPAVEGHGRKKKVSPLKVLFRLGAALLLVAVAAASLFAWNRWGRFDDHVDMQGQWYVADTAVTVSIDESSIHLADDVVYGYAIDDHDKTISYTFGDWKGQGRYWFSDDRTMLVVTDGNDFTGAGNAIDDLVKTFDDLSGILEGKAPAFPEGDGVIVFSRKPEYISFVIRSVNEKMAEEAERAAQEESESYDEYDEYAEY